MEETHQYTFRSNSLILLLTLITFSFGMYIIDIDTMLTWFINIDLCISAIIIIHTSSIRPQNSIFFPHTKGTYQLFDSSAGIFEDLTDRKLQGNRENTK